MNHPERREVNISQKLASPLSLLVMPAAWPLSKYSLTHTHTHTIKMSLVKRIRVNHDVLARKAEEFL